MIELNKVRFMDATLPSLIPFQKFLAYLLDSDKATDVLAYLLCYGLDIKDKPRTSLTGLPSRRTQCHYPV